MKEKAVTPTKHSTAYAVDEIYRTLSPKCSLDEKTKMCNYICDNLEEIQKVCDNATINNIMERIRLIASIETGRYLELNEKVKGMSTNEFIKFAGHHDEQKIFRFSDFGNKKK